MPLTTLDPKSVLIVIDLQKGILAMPTAHPIAEVLEHARQLAAGFRHKGLLVVLVNVSGGAPGRTEQSRSLANLPPDWAELVTELDRQPQDHTVTKQTWGAFTGTGLEQHLKGLGVTQVVLAGVATSIGVESTARQAHECGFNVTLALDAMTDRSLEVHQNSVERIFPRLGETGSSAEILALLERNA